MNGGIVIHEQPCPRCRIRRTVRLGLSAKAFCFNCRLQWVAGESAEPYRFDALQLARLAAYRSAIRAGLYSDWTERDPLIPCR
jgi:hypothetical protein